MLLPAIDQFSLSGKPISCEPYGSGHINATYRVRCEDGGDYILQKISETAFHDPDALMRNIQLVTDHLASKGLSRREVLTLVPTRDGASYVRLPDGCWRVYEFVRDSVCLQTAETNAQFAESAAAFGKFFSLLSDFPAQELAETIPHFHDTPARVAAFERSLAADACGRARDAQPEIEQALAGRAFAHTLMDALSRGELPLRVTHNDTKINNVLFDAATGKGLCVIDLDTVMPGLIANDFGDSIRFGANTAAEDERDLSRVSLSLDLFETYLNAYVRACGGRLTEAEIRCLPAGARMMTYECGVRFLTDYLEGDTYFHIACPEHNLLRARTQFALIRDMDRKWDKIQCRTEEALKA